MFRQAVAIARREQDAALEARALAAAAAVDAFHLRLEPMMEKCYLAISIATDAGVMDHNQYVNFLLTFSALVRGDPEAANEYFTKAVEQAQRLAPATLWLGQLVAQLKGDYELASQLNRRGLEVSERDPRVLMLRTLLELELGNMEETKVFMGRLFQAMRSTPASPSWEYAFPAIAIPMMARISGTSDLLDTAEEAAQTVLAYSQCTPLIAQVARIGLAMLAVVREDSSAGNEQYLAMSANSGQIWTLPINVDRVLGCFRLARYR